MLLPDPISCLSRLGVREMGASLALRSNSSLFVNFAVQDIFRACRGGEMLWFGLADPALLLFLHLIPSLFYLNVDHGTARAQFSTRFVGFGSFYGSVSSSLCGSSLSAHNSTVCLPGACASMIGSSVFTIRRHVSPVRLHGAARSNLLSLCHFERSVVPLFRVVLFLCLVCSFSFRGVTYLSCVIVTCARTSGVSLQAVRRIHEVRRRSVLASFLVFLSAIIYFF